VGDAALAPGNEKLLAGRPGTGAILNGPTGKTVNLLSKQEFGDVRAHVEFMVSKDSNSGVYLMGRYEVQVFDSWQKSAPYPGIECGGIYERWDESRDPKGFEVILSDPNVNAILINIFGGILRCDTLASGVVAAAKKVKLAVPLVVRLEGTNVEAGREILGKSGLDFEVAGSMKEAAEKIAKVAAKAKAC